MATKTTFIATAPDGTEMARTSARTYTHAALAYGPDKTTVLGADGMAVRDENGQVVYSYSEPSWGYLSFNGSEELAQKTIAQWEKRMKAVIARGERPSMEKFLIVPVAAR